MDICTSTLFYGANSNQLPGAIEAINHVGLSLHRLREAYWAHCIVHTYDVYVHKTVFSFSVYPPIDAI